MTATMTACRTAEESVLEPVGHAPVSAAEPADRYRMTVSPAAVSRHLQALHARGLLARRWAGDARYGCYEDFRP